MAAVAGRLGVRVLGAAVTAALLLAASTATAIWWIARQDARPTSDAIVVLGSAQYNGVPSSIFEARLEHARELYEEGVAPVVVTVGGKATGDTTTEAEAGRDYLAQNGVPEDALLAVPEGVDTLESVRAVAAEFADRDWNSAVLVSDPWHAMRAERMAEDAGLDAASSPTRQGPAVQTRATQFRYILRETAAYLLYRATGESVAGAPGIG
ncbi:MULTISPECIES: YdcF family protein [unclassified Modestobacter]|uniref:YdcF family protein n=1 Tax=unclassified Modestobacter TaxID=2643866 RepID=UPI0022AAB8BE|nr:MULTISPECIES: YdcF family protein [unclassified Modestobacter]MCZ2813179.1 YdcF family protein [Modestobacter sp. VKM Ac-2979]MCZ2842792.1 YdcF family protein [Modestobacter sp. VKM Ac-2980]MCZ2847406.1 YdcF family protein [Modestobacter sp. VKM Ac-2978]